MKWTEQIEYKLTKEIHRVVHEESRKLEEKIKNKLKAEKAAKSKKITNAEIQKVKKEFDKVSTKLKKLLDDKGYLYSWNTLLQSKPHPLKLNYLMVTREELYADKRWKEGKEKILNWKQKMADEMLFASVGGSDEIRTLLETIRKGP